MESEELRLPARMLSLPLAEGEFFGVSRIRLATHFFVPSQHSPGVARQ